MYNKSHVIFYKHIKFCLIKSFLYNQENNKWEDENGDILNINEIISANIKVNI